MSQTSNNLRAQMGVHVMERINQLAAVTEQPGIIMRTFGTPAFMKGSAMIADWMREAGLQVRTDNMGNVRGRLPATSTGRKTLVIASHMDSVVNAGRFDGPLGILLMLEVLRSFIGNGQSFPFNIELIAFSDEEGVRYHTTYLGSKVVAGAFDASLADKKDAAGISLREAVSAIGGDISQVTKDAIPANEWLGYFEVHIEQGPVLYEKDIPVALVTGIAGQKRSEI
ncbi:MAG: M20/M25/M40 family metallo-hydrolase, partial [Bacteroidetes bacterium]|nr:M20/M25/M40 family metallo-hydrolase [Bacteroidota bacterium]